MTGYRGKAMKFDGDDDYVNVSDDVSLDLAESITVEAWVYWDGGIGYQDIVRKTGAFILQKMNSANS